MPTLSRQDFISILWFLCFRLFHYFIASCARDELSENKKFYNQMIKLFFRNVQLIFPPKKEWKEKKKKEKKKKTWNLISSKYIENDIVSSFNNYYCDWIFPMFFDFAIFKIGKFSLRCKQKSFILTVYFLYFHYFFCFYSFFFFFFCFLFFLLFPLFSCFSVFDSLRNKLNSKLNPNSPGVFNLLFFFLNLIFCLLRRFNKKFTNF